MKQLLEQPLVTQSSELLVLLNEVLLEIFKHSGAVDRLFLALTCKRLLSISSMTATIIPCASKYRAFRLNCSAMLRILNAVQPLGACGRLKTSWAPCCVCYRYRPKRRSYWKGVDKQYPAYLACGILTGYNVSVDSWSERGSISYQCPECWCEERINTYGHLKDRNGIS